MTRLEPFFTFYGGKWRIAPRYPAPDRATVIEPFAGSAGYSVTHYERRVVLCDLDPVVAETWRYLTTATSDEIMALPDLFPGQTTDDLAVPEGARHLIGWWLNKGGSRPGKSPSAWMRGGTHPSSFWGNRIRERIARQVPMIRHWTIIEGSYAMLPDVDATWFIDPPYQAAGRYYRCDSSGIDYASLAKWCEARQGQTIVAEAEGATWLPFRPFINAKATPGRQKRSIVCREMIYP